MIKLFWRSYLKAIGWQSNVTFPYGHLKKYVMIVAPHTSNWDFVIGLAYRSLLDLQHVRFLGKKELFSPPFGVFFRWLGGIPVDRKSSHNIVEQVGQMFQSSQRFSIALSPEGTRKKVEKLRTGFYYIARAANVPIIMVAFDYGHRTVRFAPPFVPSNFDADFDRIAAFYAPIKGRYADQGLMDMNKSQLTERQ